MKPFWRIFKYIWPQWPRLIVVFSTAMIVAILLSAGFMTIVPLMKVMLGQEGLHGWVDRKACDWKYGVDIDLPDVEDIMTGRGEMAHSLQVAGIERDSLAHLAGLQNRDTIVGAVPAVHHRRIELSLRPKYWRNWRPAATPKSSLRSNDWPRTTH